LYWEVREEFHAKLAKSQRINKLVISSQTPYSFFKTQVEGLLASLVKVERLYSICSFTHDAAKQKTTKKVQHVLFLSSEVSVSDDIYGGQSLS